MFCGGRVLEFWGVQYTAVVLLTVFGPVVLVHQRGSTARGPRYGFLSLSIRRTGAGAPDLDRSFVAGVGNQHTGWDGPFDDKVCIASAFSISRCTDTVVIGEPREEVAVWSLH